MAIAIDDPLPQTVFSTMTPDGPKELDSKQVFVNKRVVLFGVPGAFTPTCSAKHLPGFVKHANDIKMRGVDTIACIAVNDVFVMGAWGVDQKVGEKGI